MLEKLNAMVDVFRKGSAVANPALWKAGQITATALGATFIAAAQLGKAFGYDINLDPDTATAVAGGLIALVNWALTLATSKHVGLPGLVPAGQPVSGPVPSPQEAHTAAPGAADVPSISDATRKRAEEFLRARGESNGELGSQ